MRFRSARKLLRRLLVAVVAGCALFVIAAVIFSIHCRSIQAHFQPARIPAEQRALTSRIPDYARAEDDTFLTYPEWYIVWSYQEKADFQRAHLPAAFPYYGAIAQYWSSYCCAYSIIRDRYPFNVGDHVMLAVIGTSFSVEYALKGAYENTIGRISEWSSGRQFTDEDRYAYRVAKQYADFVHIRPFYEFPFFRSLQGLWRETSLWGAHPLRKWERKAWLSLDYGVEAIYCGLIELASHATYGVESSDTYAWIDQAPDALLTKYPRIRVVRRLSPEAAIVVIPRYQEFTDLALRLAADHATFVNIAGNSQVLLSAIGPRDRTPQLPAGELLFSSQILTASPLQRLVIRCPVHSLTAEIRALATDGLTVEHVYDY